MTGGQSATGLGLGEGRKFYYNGDKELGNPIPA